jgi:uncharacterized membrane protein
MERTIIIKLYCSITILVGLWCAGILAAPVLRSAGLPGGADILYSAYARVCHQNDLLSFHVEGEKFGVCIRCSAIYFGSLASLLALLLSSGLRKLHVRHHWLMSAALVPMLLDVGFNDIGLHLSTTATRLITGAFFGSVMPWFVVPLFIEAFFQLQQKKNNQSRESGVRSHVRKTQ